MMMYFQHQLFIGYLLLLVMYVEAQQPGFFNTRRTVEGRTFFQWSQCMRFTFVNCDTFLQLRTCGAVGGVLPRVPVQGVGVCSAR